MRRDDAYLLDILIAARRPRRFLKDLTWEEFVHSELHQDAVMRPLAIIGEAARQVSQGTRVRILSSRGLKWPACGTA